MLKQLVATIGREAFQDGIREYFRRYAWGNATLADFLAALGDAAGRSLDEWARVWIATEGLNTIEAVWEVEDGRISRFALQQGAPDAHPTLRPHAMTIGLLHPELGGDSLTTQRASIDGPRADVPALVGLASTRLRVPQPRGPRLREGDARPGVARVRPGAAGGHRGPVDPAARVVVPVGHGPRRAAALDGVPGHGPPARAS